jgi:hypothetical protein
VRRRLERAAVVVRRLDDALALQKKIQRFDQSLCAVL